MNQCWKLSEQHHKHHIILTSDIRLNNHSDFISTPQWIDAFLMLDAVFMFPNSQMRDGVQHEHVRFSFLFRQTGNHSYHNNDLPGSLIGSQLMHLPSYCGLPKDSEVNLMVERMPWWMNWRSTLMGRWQKHWIHKNVAMWAALVKLAMTLGGQCSDCCEGEV